MAMAWEEKKTLELVESTLSSQSQSARSVRDNEAVREKLLRISRACWRAVLALGKRENNARFWRGNFGRPLSSRKTSNMAKWHGKTISRFSAFFWYQFCRYNCIILCSFYVIEIFNFWPLFFTVLNIVLHFASSWLVLKTFFCIFSSSGFFDSHAIV